MTSDIVIQETFEELETQKIRGSGVSIRIRSKPEVRPRRIYVVAGGDIQGYFKVVRYIDRGYYECEKWRNMGGGGNRHLDCFFPAEFICKRGEDAKWIDLVREKEYKKGKPYIPFSRLTCPECGRPNAKSYDSDCQGPFCRFINDCTWRFDPLNSISNKYKER